MRIGYQAKLMPWTMIHDRTWDNAGVAPVHFCSQAYHLYVRLRPNESLAVWVCVPGIWNPGFPSWCSFQLQARPKLSHPSRLGLPGRPYQGLGKAGGAQAHFESDGCWDIFLLKSTPRLRETKRRFLVFGVTPKAFVTPVLLL